MIEVKLVRDSAHLPHFRIKLKIQIASDEIHIDDGQCKWKDHFSVVEVEERLNIERAELLLKQLTKALRKVRSHAGG